MIGAVLEPVLDLVFPPRCPLCGDGLARQGGLCAACWSGLVMPADPSCRLCQRPFHGPAQAAAGPEAVCAPCLAEAPAHDGVAAGMVYNAPARRLILAFKYQRRMTLATMLARMIVARLPVLEGEWLVVPVPLHRWRLWSRGYNQSAELARALARAIGRPLVVDALVRTRRTRKLEGLGAAARQRELSGAIAVRPGRAARLKGAQVILVDDVMTSGATSDACIRALRRAGAARVLVACAARVMDEVLPAESA